MYGYVYITTNKINGKQYIGKHRAKKFDLNYKGSGKYLLRAFNKYGRDNFECSVLCWCNSLSELNACEIDYIKKFDAVNSDDFYNLASGGEGHTAKFSPESKLKLSISHLGYVPTETARQHMREAALKRAKRKPYKHKHPMTEEHKRKIVESRRKNNTYVVSEETRNRMSQAHKNQIPWNKGLTGLSYNKT